MSQPPPSGTLPASSPYTVQAGQPITLRAWAILLLTSMGIHPNSENVKAVVAWEQAEGGAVHNTATWNPLNTTYNGFQGKPIAGNSAGVQAYPSFLDGLNATLATLRAPRYAGVVQALRVGNANQIADAIASSGWRTGSSSYDTGYASTIKGIIASGHLAWDDVIGSPHEGQSIGDQILTSGPAGAVAGVASAIAKPFSFLELLTKGGTWKRVLFVLVGLILGVIGVLVMLQKPIVKTAKKVIPGVAAAAA